MKNKILTKISQLRLELRETKQIEFQTYDGYYNNIERVKAKIEVLIEILDD